MDETNVNDEMNANSIIGKWLVIESNRPVGDDYNTNSAGTICIFTEDGYYQIILKQGQKFRTKYHYDELNGELVLEYIKGPPSVFSVKLVTGASNRIKITDNSALYDIYERLS